MQFAWDPDEEPIILNNDNNLEAFLSSRNQVNNF